MGVQVAPESNSEEIVNYRNTAWDFLQSVSQSPSPTCSFSFSRWDPSSSINGHNNNFENGPGRTQARISRIEININIPEDYNEPRAGLVLFVSIFKRLWEEAETGSHLEAKEVLSS